ncbi:hypothetical protein CP532_3172 [Ophiocordyceps camponoti-leonardi (nom. inval.)]|nr:hypothetical protein CP532_3172 [Ophiocordyceps camponoti-leonardi (nom. inval.)]
MIHSLALLALAGATLTAGEEKTIKSTDIYQPTSASQSVVWGLSVVTAAPKATTYEAEAFPMTCTPGNSGCDPLHTTKATIVDGPKTYALSLGSEGDGYYARIKCDIDEKEDSGDCTIATYLDNLGQESPFVLRKYKDAKLPAYITAGVEKVKSGSAGTSFAAVARNAIVVGLGVLIGTIVF